jgi:hypothetical protein
MRLLAAPDPDLELGASLADVELQRHEREALRLAASDQLGDLVPVEEQLPGRGRLVVVPVPLLVRRDVRADQPRLAALDAGVRLGEVDAAGADRLDLGPGQREAASSVSSMA